MQLLWYFRWNVEILRDFFLIKKFSVIKTTLVCAVSSQDATTTIPAKTIDDEIN
jgi:hypothetical protein